MTKKQTKRNFLIGLVIFIFFGILISFLFNEQIQFAIRGFSASGTISHYKIGDTVTFYAIFDIAKYSDAIKPCSAIPNIYQPGQQKIRLAEKQLRDSCMGAPCNYNDRWSYKTQYIGTHTVEMGYICQNKQYLPPEDVKGFVVDGIASCSDTDGGIIPDVRGEVTRAGTTKFDICSTTQTNVLHEYYCNKLPNEDTEILVKSLDCGSGKVCQLGKCITSTQSCIDYDNGKDYYTKARTADSNNLLVDYCKDSNTLVEYYCPTTTSKLASEEKICQYGCENGACRKTITTTCNNECITKGSKICYGSGFRICGQYDSDPCLEYSEVGICSSGTSCSAGECKGAYVCKADFSDFKCKDSNTLIICDEGMFKDISCSENQLKCHSKDNHFDIAHCWDENLDNPGNLSNATGGTCIEGEKSDFICEENRLRYKICKNNEKVDEFQECQNNQVCDVAQQNCIIKTTTCNDDSECIEGRKCIGKVCIPIGEGECNTNEDCRKLGKGPDCIQGKCGIIESFCNRGYQNFIPPCDFNFKNLFTLRGLKHFWQDFMWWIIIFSGIIVIGSFIIWDSMKPKNKRLMRF